MNRIFRAVLTATLLLGCALPAAAQSLTTTYATNNSSGGNTFDLKSTRDLRIDSFDVHLGSAGTSTQVAVYWRTGTANGFQANPAGWTLLGTATVVSQGPGNPTHLPIGGLKQKVLAAHAAGLTEVIVPERNQPDLDDVPADVRSQMQFHIVGTVDEVLAIALEPPELAMAA